jgi:hypothetical protein
MVIWPNFFVVGAPKAGTTSLHHYLQEIPGIYVSPVKEPHYFCTETAEKCHIQRVSRQVDYLAFFDGVGDETAIGEVSPVYLRAPESPGLIAQKVPEAKIIICLRDPIDRAISHYWMHWRVGIEVRSFREALNDYCFNNNTDSIFSYTVMESGFYFKQVKRYLDIFGRGNVLFIIFEEFKHTPHQTLAEICRFLGVNASTEHILTEAQNAYYEPRNKLALAIVQNKMIRKLAKKIIPQSTGWSIVRTFFGKKASKPQMGAYELDLLKKIYEDDSSRLTTLLGRPLPWPVAGASSLEQHP